MYILRYLIVSFVTRIVSLCNYRFYYYFSLKKQLSASLSAARLAAQVSSPCSTPREDAITLSQDDRKALEERATAVRAELESRRANIQELKRRLEKTHVTEYVFGPLF